MSPISNRLFIRLGSFFESAAEGPFAISAQIIAFIAIVIIAVIRWGA